MQGRVGENSSSDEDDRSVRGAKSTAIVFGSSGAVVQKSDQNATATREVDTELEKDQRWVDVNIRGGWRICLIFKPDTWVSKFCIDRIQF